MDKVTNGLNRLNAVLPLKERQNNIDSKIVNIHRNILKSYVEKGRTLNRSEMAIMADDLEETIEVLKKNDMVVFNKSNEPIGAYPFTMEAREHVILVNGHKIHAMCALDALGVSPMFDHQVEIISRCRVTNEPIYIKQKGLEVLNKDETKDIHFGIIWNAASSSCCSTCADSLCMEMMFLKDTFVASHWLGQDSDNREVYTLKEAIDFSDRFFTPLIKH